MPSDLVDLMFFAIRRRQQMENLRQYDEEEWPAPHLLEGYTSKYDPDFNYYDVDGRDYFLELGEWLRDRNIRRQKEYEQNRKEQKVRDIKKSFH